MKAVPSFLTSATKVVKRWWRVPKQLIPPSFWMASRSAVHDVEAPLANRHSGMDFSKTMSKAQTRNLPCGRPFQAQSLTDGGRLVSVRCRPLFVVGDVDRARPHHRDILVQGWHVRVFLIVEAERTTRLLRIMSSLYLPSRIKTGFQTDLGFTPCALRATIFPRPRHTLSPLSSLSPPCEPCTYICQCLCRHL